MYDAQSRAFRENPRPTPDEELRLHAEAVHRSGSHRGVMLPEDWEALHWDSERSTPKTIDEARTALNARIFDPLAPDGREVLGAYDELGDR